MSEPVRYDYDQASLNRSAGFYVRKEGHWVRWDDHATALQEIQRLKGIILAQSSDFVRNAVRQEEEPKPEGHNDLAGRAVEHCLKLQTENEQLRHALDLIVEGYEQGSVDGFNLGLMAAKECKQNL